MYILNNAGVVLKVKRNLPIIYKPKKQFKASVLENQGVNMDIKTGTIPQYINIFLIVFGVLGAGGWYMGSLDSSIKTVDSKIESIIDLQKTSNLKFEQLAQGLVSNQIKIAKSTTKITALDKKIKILDERQYQNRNQKGKKRRY